MVNNKTGFGMTLRECAELAGAVIVYCSLYDPEFEGPEEHIVIEHKGRLYQFSHIQRAKSFLLALSSESVAG
jgi:hypothetical protein